RTRKGFNSWQQKKVLAPHVTVVTPTPSSSASNATVARTSTPVKFWFASVVPNTIQAVTSVLEKTTPSSPLKPVPYRSAAAAAAKLWTSSQLQPSNFRFYL